MFLARKISPPQQHQPRSAPPHHLAHEWDYRRARADKDKQVLRDVVGVTPNTFRPPFGRRRPRPCYCCSDRFHSHGVDFSEGTSAPSVGP